MRIHQLLAGVALVAVMNIAYGTNLFVGVDPTTGESRFYIASGQVKAQRPSGTDQPGTPLYPSQQIQLLPGEPGGSNGTSSTPLVDLDTFIASAGPEVIEAILKNKAAIDQENAAFIAQQQALLSGGGQTQAPNIETPEDLERLQKNLDNLIGNIINKAIELGKVDADRIQKMVNEVNQGLSKKIDLASTKPPELSAQEKAKLAQIKLLEAERQKKQEAAKSKQEELKKQNEELQAKLREQQAKQKAEKEKAAEAAKKKAEEEYAKKLNDTEKAAFEARQKALAEEKEKQAEAKKKAEQGAATGPMAGMPKEASGRDGDQSAPSAGGDGGSPGPSAGNLPAGQPGEARQELAEQIANLVAPGQSAPQRPDNQTGTPPAGTAWAPETGGRYDPNAPVNGDALRQLVNGSPLPPIPPTTLAGMLHDVMAMGLKDPNAPSDSKRDADQAAEDKLLRDFVEQIAALDRFPYITANAVSEFLPTPETTGKMGATYNGILSGAFGDGTEVGGAMRLDVNFESYNFTGRIDFDGSNGSAEIGNGSWDGALYGDFSGEAYGGVVTGEIRDGKFYGPKGQEIGGDWSMYVEGDGARAGHRANGKFATKQ